MQEISSRVHSVIRADGFTKFHGPTMIWGDLSFEVGVGSSLALWGPSGSGKSTLLECLGLLDRATSGSLQIEGVDVTRASPRERRRHFRGVVGHLFQNYGLVESWSVRQNLDVAFIGQRLTRSERLDSRESVLERVELPGLSSRKVFSLSGGEQQRVALARLLIRSPRVVLADEPSAALDDGNVRMVLGVLAELRTAGSAIVIATHDQRVADWCDSRLELSAAHDGERSARGAAGGSRTAAPSKP